MYKLLMLGIGKYANDYMQGNYIDGFIDSVSKTNSFHGYPVFWFNRNL